MATSSVLRHAFHDLSTHASIFRAKLIEEFQLLDNITDSRNVQAPVYNSRDIKGALRRI
jgi:cation channel sperm-associated protein 2